MQSRFAVTMIWCSLVGGEEGQNVSGVRAGQYYEPVNRSEDGLLDRLEFGEVGVVRVRIGYGVDGADWAVLIRDEDAVTVLKAKTEGGMLGECLLGDMKWEVSIWMQISLKGWSEEEVYITHEISSNCFVQEFLETILLCVQLREGVKVINIETYVDGMSGSCGWCTRYDDPREDAGVVLRGGETHVFQKFCDQIVSVLRWTPQDI